MYEWCVGGAMNGQRGVCSHRHHRSSEMRSAIYSTARLLNWGRRREGKTGGKEVSVCFINLLFCLKGSWWLCSFSLSLPSFILSFCVSLLRFCAWLNVLCSLKINLLISFTETLTFSFRLSATASYPVALLSFTTSSLSSASWFSPVCTGEDDKHVWNFFLCLFSELNPLNDSHCAFESPAEE